MKKFSLVFCVLFIALFLLTACSDNSKVYKDVMNEHQLSAKEAEEPDVEIEDVEVEETEDKETIKQGFDVPESGTLTIYTSSYSDELRAMAYRYTQLHPNVNIDFASLYLDSEEERKVKIASGTAGDIIELQTLDTYKLSCSGILENLSYYMTNDPEWNREEYYTNILDGLMIDDSLYCMPFAFGYSVVRLNVPLLEKIDVDPEYYEKITSLEICDLYQSCCDVADVGEKLKIPEFNFFRQEISSMHNPFLQRAEFSGFHDFLEYSKLLDERTASSVVDSIANDPLKDDFRRINESVFLSYVEASAANMNIKDFDLTDDRNSYPIPICNKNGELVYRVTFGPFGISSKSENKILAWDFIKFCTANNDYSDRLSLGLGFQGFSINKKVNEQLYERMRTGKNDESFEIVEKTLNCLSVPVIFDDGFTGILFEVNKYLNGQNTAEETLKNSKDISDKYFMR